MTAARILLDLLVPSLCAACGRRGPETGAPICERCARRLAAAGSLRGSGPPGLDRAWSSAAHQGVARELVVALKFRRLLPVASLMAARVASLAPVGLLSGTIVPVPAAPLRQLRRGFDPAEELAAALARECGLELCDDCLARSGAGRQVGRRRARRLGDPPRVRAVGPAPRGALLVDDVLTTGATLSACARALRQAGAVRVVAVTFSRRP